MKQRILQFTNLKCCSKRAFETPVLMVYYFLFITLKNILSLAFSLKTICSTSNLWIGEFVVSFLDVTNRLIEKRTEAEIENLTHSLSFFFVTCQKIKKLAVEAEARSILTWITKCYYIDWPLISKKCVVTLSFCSKVPLQSWGNYIYPKKVTSLLTDIFLGKSVWDLWENLAYLQQADEIYTFGPDSRLTKSIVI